MSAKGDATGMRPHSHPHSLEICWMLRGNVEWWSGIETYDLHPGDVIVTLPRVAHGAVDSALSPCEYLWVHIDVRELHECLIPAIDQHGFSGLHRQKGALGDLVSSIFSEHLNRDALSSATCASLAVVLISKLARQSNSSNPCKMSPLICKAQGFMLKNASDALTVREIADHLFVSEAWLTKKFRLEVGQTPSAWMMGQRINTAKKLLRTTETPVVQIALELGFTSSQYFATSFRRITGRTPSAYRSLFLGPEGGSLAPESMGLDSYYSATH